MGKDSEEIKKVLLNAFPGLQNDKDFKLTSQQNVSYNCIAWACMYQDRWIEPIFDGIPPRLDAVRWWPPGVPMGSSSENLKNIFKYHGYVECDSCALEEGYKKVALYCNPDTGEWSHASRQLRSGFWTSKIGQASDIQHGTPQHIEGRQYGEVYCYMKKPVTY